MRSIPSATHQHGVALIVALMFLIVLTLLGLAAMRGTTLEERMAGSSRDYNTALQAAEATLRDAEIDLMGSGLAGYPRVLTFYTFPTTLWGTASPSGCIAGGLCVVYPAETVQLYNTSSVDWSTSGTTSVRYGTYTGATALVGVANQPRYTLELLNYQVGGQTGGLSGDLVYVRITARAWGASSQTQVYLQEVFTLHLSGT